VEAKARRSPRARERARTRRAERRRRTLIWAGRLAVLAAVFLVGLVVGKAVEQGSTPSEGPNQTLVRTLLPQTLTPQETVTITVSKP
jgi:hypothetical protein